ncbi:neuron navigator 2 isoform X3 [Ixodes scapularis]|uniref:neuron navigator 2 isoform X3 n=1 Tax=Ixodes scapularis TaxID=6945 RepID=UPI001C394547|nr:neuron navigator 2 isoform X3 [Ixodes scapularis]
MATVAQRRIVRRPTGISGLAAPKSSANSSRSGSPHTGSFIPQPKATVITRDRNTSDRSRPSSTASASSISHLPVKSAVGVPVRQQQPASAANGHAGHKAAGANNAANVSLNNNSMLDKFKFFNSKDKGAHDKSKGTASRRPSSSSGLSSARSEKSDSSVSLCGDPPGSPSPGTSPAPAVADAFQAKFHSTAAPASHCNGGVPNSALVAEGTEASVNSPAAGVKSLSKKNFGRSIGKHPAATTTKTTPVANAAPNSSDVVRSGLPRSSPSTDTLSRNASKSTNGGGSRPTSTGHELSGQVAVGKSSSFQDSNIHSSATDDKQSDMNNGTPNPGSGIPKPTAAVKGTSKHSREDLSVLSTLPPEKPEKPDKAREDANPMTTIATSESMASLKSPGSKEHVHAQQDQVTSQSTGKPETQHKNDRSKKNSQQNVSIAMVSPIMSTQHSLSKDSITSSTESSTATSIISKKEPQDNKDTKGSLVGGMESTIKSVSAETKPVPKSNASEAKDGDEVEDALANIQPMQPLNRASPYGGYARSLSGHRAARLPACLRLQADVHRVARHMMAASQDIARLYGAQRVGTASDYAELTAGYVSDGDVLRAPTAEEVASGYMSEGGASLYARRPVRCPVKDPKLVNVLQDDSHCSATLMHPSVRHLCAPRKGFDDSSSISSGLSDTFAEISTNDLTDSSLSSDPYGCLKRHHYPVMTAPCNKYSSTTDKSSSRKADQQASTSASATIGVPLLPTTSVRSRNANVKKTDSSMQTDSSALQQNLTSANWKRYVQQQEQSKTNSTESLKSKESKRSAQSSKTSKSLDSNKHEVHKSKSKTTSGKGDDSSKLRSYSAELAGAAGDGPLDKGRSGAPKSGTEYVVNSRKLVNRAPNAVCVAGKRPSSTASTGSGRSGSSQQSKREGSDLEHRTSSLTRTGEMTRGSRSSLERKAKVSGSTQTVVNDMFISAHSDSEYSSLGRSAGKHAKQYLQASFASPTLGSMRERIYGTRTLLNGSPPSYASNADYALLSGFQHGPVKDRPRLSVPSAKGSESDNYMTLDHGSPYAWLRHSPTSGSASVASAPVGRSFGGPGIAEADSMESLSSTASSAHGQGGSRYMYISSPLHTASHAPRNSMTVSHYMGGLLSKMATKDDDAHGSSLSLVSTNSSLYSTTEEKQAHEIRKLRKELDQANEKVATLTSQLTTNAHMVAAFEQSLSNMTSRLQHLTATAEQKDSELTELRSTIEALKQQSAEAGLTKMALQSMAAVHRSMGSSNGGGGGHPPSGCSNLVRRHTFNTPKDTAALQDHRMSRQLSTDSMSSVNSASSACSNASTKNEENGKKHKKKKGWLRSSFSKAFSRSKKNRHGSVSDVEDIRAFQSDSSAPNSPLLSLNPAHANGLHSNLADHNMLKLSHSSFALHEREEEGGPEVVQELRKQLREKDLVLTDIRLEALSSAHQLDNLKETLARMRNEMLNLKQDNDRLQRLVSSKSLNSSQTSLPHRNSMDTLENRLSAAELSPTFDVPDVTAAEIPEGKRVTIAIQLGCHGDLEKFLSKSETPSEVLIGSIYVSGKTKWDHLDSAVRRAFKDHVLKVDPLSNLGLNSESILCYHIDDVVRSKEAELPELLPCGYLVGETLKIQIVLRGTAQNAVDALALQTLIPKSIVQRYVSLLSEHRRIILCGPSGTGKTFLAQKLAEYLVLRSGRDLAAGSIATFSVDHKSAKELRQYLSNVAEQCESSNVSDLPAVIILDNLHHVGSLGEVFNGFLSAKYQKCPFIIGTMNQATCSTTNLQLHHNFRWVLCANHMEPVKGFLGRFLRRRLAEEEIASGLHQPELAKVIDWMPRAWHHLNRFLETHSSSDVTIGPRLFLACPMDVASSQVWFTDLWNYSIVPYLLEAVREGLQLYGKRAPWEDPAEWVLQTYPWPGPASDAPQLLRLRPEDLGYDPSAGPKVASDQPDADADPLLNMLMRLQEAASYSSPQGNDSESADLDHSNGSDRVTPRSEGFEPSL